ncbi:MAG: TerC family protein, partial [Slackia sp.]|nr:TerC family protein [Slackia sp.]
KKSRWQEETAAQIETVRAEMLERIEEERAKAAESNNTAQGSTTTQATPIFIGGNVYIMAPVDGEDAKTFREQVLASATAQHALNKPIEIEYETVEEDASSDSKN